MKRALVTTTINDISKWLPRWMAQLTVNDVVVVVGDDKTPHDKVMDALAQYDRTYYIDPRFPSRWKSTDVLGRNTIQRRNLGFLDAAAMKADLIISVDDDNVPVNDTWLEQITQQFGSARRVQAVSTSSGWFNPGEICLPRTVCRGFPIDQLHRPYVEQHIMEDDVRCGVFQSMVLGDPDVDAVTRIVDAPEVVGTYRNVTLADGTWAPFNSQATVFRTELLPCMMMWPGVGRYDDIWASFLCQAVMQPFGYRVRFGAPCVRQDRNEHDLIRDLELELHGYRHTTELTAALRAAYIGLVNARPNSEVRKGGVWGATRAVMSMITDVMYDLSPTIIPEITRHALEAWLIDTEKVLSE